MASENRLPLLIFAVLVTLIAAPLIWTKVRDARRPRLVGARIVTATADDPVFSTGPRRVGPDDEVLIALALEVEDPRGRRWLAPAESLDIDGAPVQHTVTDRWPEPDRQLRVFWFTVENANLGGTLDAENSASKLRYRTFLAPEMGRGLAAEAVPEAHNDDHLGQQSGSIPVNAGTLRIYAKAEIVDPETSEVKAVQAIATGGADRILDPGFPAIQRSLEVPEGLHPEVGELFNLPCWEVAAGEPDLGDDAAEAAFGMPFHELVTRRILTSSRTFAAVATTGSPEAPDLPAGAVDEVSIRDGSVIRGRRGLTWAEVRPGDWLVDGEHVAVLMADDGNELVDGGDTVLHCWRGPPAVTTLESISPAQPTLLKLVRHGR